MSIAEAQGLSFVYAAVAATHLRGSMLIPMSPYYAMSEGGTELNSKGAAVVVLQAKRYSLRRSPHARSDETAPVNNSDKCVRHCSYILPGLDVCENQRNGHLDANQKAEHPCHHGR